MEYNYLIGIDLGTTNTVVHYIDKREPQLKVEVLKFPQITALGEVSELLALPSFIYIPDDNELKEGQGLLALPWDPETDYAIGEFAKSNASKNPMKCVASSKSWLCSRTVDRTGAILPWNRNNPEKQISPVTAATRIMKHIRDTWNNSVASDSDEDKIENQKIVLTVPASFDVVARELTVRAAEQAGLNITLLEEPQAAFYSWLAENENSWREQISPGDIILICDIGGGTTDFSLIRADDNDGNLVLERVAVGRHILLGGDNMDLALAYTLAGQLRTEGNMKLSQYQINGLTHGCREAKERLLVSTTDKPEVLTVLGQGSSLIGSTINVELTRDVVEQIILNGFFPDCELTDKPKVKQKTGLRTFGLEYEDDPAITVHLAEFLSQHCSDGIKPNRVLFNGGVTKSPAVMEKILKNISSWFGLDEISVLEGTDPDLAVSKGGCYYATVKEGRGIRIKSGSSRTYYIGVESTMPAIPGFEPPLSGLCVIPFGLEEGSEVTVPFTGLGLVVGEVTEFRFFSTTLRPDEQVGEIVDELDSVDGIDEMPELIVELPVEDDIPPGSLVPVTLHCELTETGTVRIYCHSEKLDRKWKLEFELRTESEK